VFAVEVISADMSFIELRRITFEKVDDLVAHRLVPVGLVAASKEALRNSECIDELVECATV
jgi:hypothetical protein